MDVRQLQARNEALQEQLEAARRASDEAAQQQQRLQRDNTELRRVLDQLTREKRLRVAESSTLRREVRSFIQAEMDGLRSFLLQSDLLDYIGAERVQRPLLDERPLVLVDLAHPIPRPGLLTGVGGLFSRAGQFQVMVLRPVEAGYLTVWRSQLIKVAEAGRAQFDFAVSVGVETGDIVAYRFPERGLVPYGQGTGDTRYRVRSDLATGEMVSVAQLEGAREQRAYSIGVFGLLNTD
jgi:hypothetical protein